MKNSQRFLIGTVACLLASGASLGSVGLAEAPEVPNAQALQKKLDALQDEWAQNQTEYVKQQDELHQNAKDLRNQLCSAGEKKHCPKVSSPKVSANGVDIRKLAYAVAMAETENCTTGTGLSRNNCHGIRGCSNGQCGFKTYDSPAESYADFESIWLRVYGNRFPTREDAKKYVASEATDWYKTVTAVYYGNRTPVVPD